MGNGSGGHDQGRPGRSGRILLHKPIIGISGLRSATSSPKNVRKPSNYGPAEREIDPKKSGGRGDAAFRANYVREQVKGDQTHNDCDA